MRPHGVPSAGCSGCGRATALCRAAWHKAAHSTHRRPPRVLLLVVLLVAVPSLADGPTIVTSAGGDVRPDGTLSLTAQATGEAVHLSAEHEPEPGEALPTWLTATSTVAATRDPRLEITISPPENALPQQFTLAASATDSGGLTSQAEIPWQVLAPLCSGTLEYDDGGTCSDCPAHSVPNVAKTRCDSCPADSERPAGATACTPCASGLTSRAGEGCRCPGAAFLKDGVCLPCPLHHESGDNANNCRKCPAGQQRLAGMEACQACPAGQTSISGGACARPTLRLTASPPSIDESAGPQMVTVRATASVNADSPLVVPLVFGGTAMSADYALTGTTTIVIAKDARQGSTVLTVTPVDDGIADEDETIDIGTTLASHTVTGASLIIEEPTPALFLSTSPAWIGEPSGAQPVVVTARAHAVLAAALTVPLTLAGTATSTDYTVSGSSTVVITSGSREASTTLTITPVNDLLADDGETIQFDAAIAGYRVTGAVLTIRELAPAITISASPARIDESGGLRKVVVTAATNVVSNSSLAVPLTLGGTATAIADYTTGRIGTVTIPATKRQSTTLVEITPVDDGVADDGETIVFDATVPGFAVTTATVTIEEPDPAIALAASPTELDEDGSAQPVVVEATANAVVGTALTLPLRFSGTATASTDYAVAGTRSVTIAAGTKSGSTTLAVTPVDDGVKDDEETIEIGAAAAGYAVASTTLKILEPPPVLELHVSPSTLDESGGAQSVEVTAKRESAENSVLTVPLTFGGTATRSDYAVAGAQGITIAASQQTGTTTLIITPVDDAVADDRETIEIGASLADHDVKLAILTIKEPPPTVTLSVSPVSILEHQGAQVATVKAQAATPVAATATVSLTLAGTATPTIDYAVSGTRSVTIQTGQSSNTTTLTITPVLDTVPDDGETIAIDGTADGYRVESTTLAIAQPTIVLSTASTTLSENAGVVAVTMTVANPPSSGSYRKCRLEVAQNAVDTAVDRADYRLATPTRRLQASENWRAQTTITVLPDAISEAAETFTVRGRCGGSSRRTSPRHEGLDSRPLQLTITDASAGS